MVSEAVNMDTQEFIAQVGKDIDIEIERQIKDAAGELADTLLYGVGEGEAATSNAWITC
jgi:hypothetical protein